MKFLHVDKRRVLLALIGVIFMGLSLSFLNPTKFGADPFTCMNLAISEKIRNVLPFVTFGTWQAFLNIIMFVLVVVFDRGQIGWGTVFNMILVGYCCDFFTWVNGLWMPAGLYDSMTTKILIAVPTLIVFIFAASLYMAADLGASPYDALPFIISTKLKLPFRPVRIGYDATFMIIGLCFGATLGFVTIGIVLGLGPVVAWMKEKVVAKLLK